MKSWDDFRIEEPALAEIGKNLLFQSRAYVGAEQIQDRQGRQALIDDTHVLMGENEVLFELLLERVMYTRLVNQGAPDERPIHRKWRAT